MTRNKKEYCPICYAEILWAEGEDNIEVAFDIESTQAAAVVDLPHCRRTYAWIPTHALHEDTCSYKEDSE